MGTFGFYQQPEDSKLRNIVNWIIHITLVIVLAVFLLQNIGIRVQNEGTSMEPRLKSGDEVFVDRICYNLSSPKRYDLAAFKKEETASKVYIKRIIALPGETIQIINGTVYVDDKPLTSKLVAPISLPGLAGKPITLGTNEYFLLGDNMESSEDSRFMNIGNVSGNQLIGKVWFRISPLAEAGFLINKE